MPTIHEILPRNDLHLFRCPSHGGSCLKACRAPIDCAQAEGDTTAAGVAAALNEATPDDVTFTAEAEPFPSAPLHPEPLEEDLAMVDRRPILAALRASGVRISKYGTMSLEPEHIGRLATAVIAAFGVEAGELADEPEQPAVLGARPGAQGPGVAVGELAEKWRDGVKHAPDTPVARVFALCANDLDALLEQHDEPADATWDCKAYGCARSNPPLDKTLAGATWEQGPTGRDELRLRDGTLLVPNGGSGAALAPRHGIGRLPPDHELGGPSDATHGDSLPPYAETRRSGPPLGWVTLDPPPVGCDGLYHQELRINLTISEAGRLGWSRVGITRPLDGKDVPLDARVYLVRRWLESTRNRCICPGEATRDCPVHGWDE